MMALGFFLRQIKIFNDVTVKQMNAAVFRVFLPVMLFKNVYQSSMSEVFNGRLLAFALIAAVGIRKLRFGDVVTDIVAEGDLCTVKANAPYTLMICGKAYEIQAGEQTFTL